jgi:cytidine deaminase
VSSAAFDWSELLDSARRAAHHAHSPFSKFRVGAVVMDADGVIYVGCNIESASYGLTICAERVAIFTAIAAGSTKLRRLAVTCLDAPEGEATLRMPCGACRQVMAELLEPNAEILIDGVGVVTMDNLLPNVFKLPF